MNYKKGLVALAITGALAAPLTANAAARLVTYGGQDTTPTTQVGQFGPQTNADNGTAAFAEIVGIDYDNVVNDDLTVDQILAGFRVDLDADTVWNTNGSFVGSMRTDVTLAYAADTAIPNEATFEFKIHNGSNGTANGGIRVSDIQSVRIVAQVAGGLGTPNTFVEVGSVASYTVNPNDSDLVDSFVIQIDTNTSEVDGNQFFGRNHDGSLTVDPDDIVPAAPLQANFPLPENIQLFLTTDSAINSGAGTYNPTTWALSDTATKGDEIHLNLEKVTNTAGVPLTALFTGSVNSKVITVTDGFELTVVDQATTTIEVETDRTTFADCETWDETVTTTDGQAFQDYVCATSGDRLISRAKVMFASGSDVGLDVQSTNTMEFTLSRLDGESISGVEDVTFGQDNTGTGGVTVTANINEEFKGSGTLATLGLMDALNNNLEANIDIEANGVDPLFPNAQSAEDWVLSGVVIKQGGSITQDVNVPVVYGETSTVLGGITYNRDDAESVKIDGVTHVWGIDGALFKTPYLYSLPNANGWGSVVKVTNEFPADAGIQADIIIAPAGEGAGTDAGFNTPAVGNTFVGVKLPKMVPAEGQYTFNGTDLINAINTQFGAGTVDASLNWHIEATFLVNAPQNFVHAAAQNKSPDGRADSPVLYKTNNNNDGRQWQ
ncbi:hypothetical protein [Pseudoalteromonas spongiae]|uniref:hypothetical protein n=1 Tax=Pseudoalteromonas spongiae TaxID=298657 RepID=UPI003735D656